MGAAGRSPAAVVTRRLAAGALALLALAWSWSVQAEPAPSGAGRPASAGDAVAYGRTFDALVALVRREYWDPGHLDWQAWADEYRPAAVAAPDRAAFDAVMRRMLRALADDHSSWIGLPGAPDDADALPGTSDVGPPRLGVQFSFVAGRGLLVERVFPDTPAAAAGLQRGDVIVRVDDDALGERRGVIDANAVLVEALERGSVRLVVERRRVTLEMVVESAPVTFAEVANVPYRTMLDAATGYLAVPTLNAPGVGVAVHRALADLVERGAVALVLDLRGNQGGRLAEAGLVVGAFLAGEWAAAVARDDVAWRATAERLDGDLLSLLIRPSGEVVGAARAAQPVAWRDPVVVLVDRGTVSAAELVALALQDHGRAAVVGERTAGNVEAVQGFTLPDGSRVMVAVADMRGTRGLAFAAGVVPDVVARAANDDLARGVDAALVEARRLLGRLPFTPDRRFRRRRRGSNDGDAARWPAASAASVRAGRSLTLGTHDAGPVDVR